jgi:glycosyltransferase involved in cell wall biosynthesis
MDQVDDSMLGPAAVDRRVIPNGVDLATFAPGDRAAARAELGLPQDAAVLLFAASGIVDNPWKDWQALRSALGLLAAHRAARGDSAPLLVALGEERAPERLEGAEIRFLPFQTDPSRVAVAYRAADVYMHATRADTFPTTVLEALACGLPVVATAVGGIPEQVRSGGPEPTGALVPQGDAASLAAAAGALLDDPERRRRTGTAAAADARARFDARRMTRSYLEWFAEAVPC